MSECPIIYASKWNHTSTQVTKSNAEFEIRCSQWRGFLKNGAFHQRWACCNGKGKNRSRHGLHGDFDSGLIYFYNGIRSPPPFQITNFLLAFLLLKCFRRIIFCVGVGKVERQAQMYSVGIILCWNLGFCANSIPVFSYFSNLKHWYQIKGGYHDLGFFLYVTKPAHRSF